MSEWTLRTKVIADYFKIPWNDFLGDQLVLEEVVDHNEILFKDIFMILHEYRNQIINNIEKLYDIPKGHNISEYGEGAQAVVDLIIGDIKRD